VGYGMLVTGFWIESTNQPVTESTSQPLTFPTSQPPSFPAS
jgi:hypothetical protein